MKLFFAFLMNGPPPPNELLRPYEMDALAHRLGLTTTLHFWKFWKAYYCTPEDQRHLFRQDPMYQEYVTLLWRLHREVEHHHEELKEKKTS